MGTAATALEARAAPADTSKPRTPSFGYFDDDDRLGVIGRGATVEQALEGAADAVFAVIADHCSDRPTCVRMIDFEEPDPASALVTWLNRLLEIKRRDALFLTRFQLRRTNNHWHGEVSGEPLGAVMQRERQITAADSTLATVAKTGSTWEARCLVDW